MRLKKMSVKIFDDQGTKIFSFSENDPIKIQKNIAEALKKLN